MHIIHLPLDWYRSLLQTVLRDGEQVLLGITSPLFDASSFSCHHCVDLIPTNPRYFRLFGSLTENIKPMTNTKHGSHRNLFLQQSSDASWSGLAIWHLPLKKQVWVAELVSCRIYRCAAINHKMNELIEIYPLYFLIVLPTSGPTLAFQSLSTMISFLVLPL